ncbi:MAG TPA: DUF4339 domain-containing protein [Phycisphaerae bacterium]|nr:DUF4339 domain-containing protein [Phycisphaerae bacterium]
MTVPPPPPAQSQWHYMMGQQRLGPVTTEALVAMIQTGAITSATLLWREGMGEWSPAGSLPEFSSALTGAKAKEENYLGLNTSGLIVFIILLVACLPLCWLPWVIDSLKAKTR